jgi:hypothetical protein
MTIQHEKRLPVDLDHKPADLAEATEMLWRARLLLHDIEQEVHRITGNEGEDDVLTVLRRL